MAKQVRMEDVDRISHLPDAILSHILSFLSTKKAVRTSILSTRWRYLFASVSNLDFELNDRCLPRQKSLKSSITSSFMNFVDKVLFFHNRTSIEKFRLKCGQGVDSTRVYGWISAALWRGVQHLDLNISIDKFTTLPGVLFTCRALVTLKLDINFVFNVPNDVCFPNLKTLHLKSVVFSNDDSVQRLFSNCVVLEDLVIEGCGWEDISKLYISNPLLKRLTIDGKCSMKIAIDAPNLVYLKYRTKSVAAGLINLKCLVMADIGFLLVEAPSKTYHDHRRAATKFFRGINTVRSLNLSIASLELLLCFEQLPVFGNVVEMKIPVSPWNRISYSTEKGLETLLTSLPKLEKLVFHEGVFILSCLPEKVPFCLSFKLKAIEISGFKAEKDCIEKAKYFLKNATALKKLTIRTYYLTEEGKLKITEELLASPRKSKQCCILIF
ncbi:hypothetical protein REPUB_Repub05bG0039400 [Reevesia pubescens]